MKKAIVIILILKVAQIHSQNDVFDIWQKQGFYPSEWTYFDQENLDFDKNHCWYDITKKKKRKKIVSLKYDSAGKFNQIIVNRTYDKSIIKMIYSFKSEDDLTIDCYMFTKEDTVKILDVKYEENMLKHIEQKSKYSPSITTVNYAYEGSRVTVKQITARGIIRNYNYEYDDKGNETVYYVEGDFKGKIQDIHR